MDRTAIILAGGVSKRFGVDKGFLKIGNKSLLFHVANIVNPIVDETIIVTNSKNKARKYSKEISNLNLQYTLDLYKGIGPLAGALTGLESANGKYSLIIPFDTPFMSKKILSLLFNLCKKNSAVIPRWPNNNIEPLQAVYQTQCALIAARNAIIEKETQVRAIIQRLNKVHYVSTEIFKKYDPKLRTFFNINTPVDLVKAKEYFKQKR